MFLVKDRNVAVKGQRGIYIKKKKKFHELSSFSLNVFKKELFFSISD